MRSAPVARSISTRFRVLVEIASRQPSVQQKDVARELGLTVQAVSEQVRDLVAAGMVASRGRASYAVTPSGVDWLLRHTRELQSYADRVSRLVRDITVTAAVADVDLDEGTKVSLEMRHGVLHACEWREDDPASGVVVAPAREGTDVGVTGIQGIIPLLVAEVFVAVTPAVQYGGSRGVDCARLRRIAGESRLVAAMGVEALVALGIAGVEPLHRWAPIEAVIDAASSGEASLLVCSESELPRVSDRLSEAGVTFSVLDLALTTSVSDQTSS